MSDGSVTLADMAGTLTVDELIRVLRAEADLLAGEAAQAFVTDPVPTCPQWSVRDLVEHTGGVHRWAATVVKGALTRDVPDAEQELLFRAPADPDELLAWFTRGTHELVQALEAAPADLRTFVFLNSAPPPRQFWTRRQAHETTIHRVDALAARLGRMPSTHEADISREVAIDGLDELLVGFVQRRSSKLRHTEPYWVTIAPTRFSRSRQLSKATPPRCAPIIASSKIDRTLCTPRHCHPVAKPTKAPSGPCFSTPPSAIVPLPTIAASTSSRAKTIAAPSGLCPR